MTFRVRDAQPADEPAIARVAESAIATLRATYRPSAGMIARAADRRRLRRLVAIDADDSLVGTLAHDNGHVVGLFVHTDHRRRGVARQLLDAIDGRASLYTIRETGNVLVFERLGFRIVREQPAVDYVAVADEHATLTEVYMER
ncbi:MAG TPA: GNAT family N-acetyltransferase [Kofleriaceae bacterium]